MTPANRVNLVVAHVLEAKSLLEKFRISQRLASEPYPIYRSQEGIYLIIAGMGRQAAAAATTYLGQWQTGQSAAVAGWLNVGVAGHQQIAVGEGVLAHKIIERESSSCFYPTQMFSGFDTSDVITVDEPELDYPENAAYEMEASGFYSSALRFATAELCQVYKVISDNPFNPVTKIDAKFVNKCMSGQCDQIQQLLAGLKELVRKYNEAYKPPEELEQLLAKVNPSVTQQIQLKRLCQRYHALNRSADLQVFTNKSFGSARQLITELKFALRQSMSQ